MEAELYTDAGAARATIRSTLENINVESREYMKELTAKKQHVVISLDSSFKIELADFAFVSGEGGDKVVQAKILEMLPSSQHEESVIGPLAKLVALRESDMAKCCARAAPSQLKLVVERAENMQKGVEPRIHTLVLSDFMQKVGETIPWFMSLTICENRQEQGVARCKRHALEDRERAGPYRPRADACDVAGFPFASVLAERG